ncbi:DUF3040 domain-containing protein [Serinibacter salmoneus]|uniref:DUF3040 family protein n=1 Tax=Serinibacter salmoneus TaxID=556530 RepID=A0A2A9CY67_9MICO|nr:DUF3040 domain-containing protein [Serinibacter salmoneus]PFG19377.1 Protein of unknown function (DUF3040) [Serinibacter salmoneus]
MPLSEYEQRVLAQMEQQLSSDDPKLAQSFAGKGRQTSRVVLGVLGLAAGLGVLLVGVSQHWTWLGLVGFLLMFAGALIALSSGGRGKGVTKGGEAAPAAKAQRSSFMTKLDERWDRRRDEGR